MLVVVLRIGYSRASLFGGCAEDPNLAPDYGCCVTFPISSLLQQNEKIETPSPSLIYEYNQRFRSCRLLKMSESS